MTLDSLLPGVPEARVRIVAALPEHLSGAVRISIHAQARPGAFLMNVPGVARYLARDGGTIAVAPEDGADPDAVRLFLYGTVRAALIHQRGELPFHAATLVHPAKPDSAVAICAASGLGKSTLAAELSRRGWLLVADDTTRITFGGARVIAWPGRPAIKLWRDACDRLGLPTTALSPVRAGFEKFFVPAAARDTPVPLAAIFELASASAVALTSVNGAARLALLSENTVRPRQIGPLGRVAEHVRIVSQVSPAVKMFRLEGARTQPPSVLADLICGAVA